MPGSGEKTIYDLAVGMAGCGAMGLPMANALLAAGFKVRGFDVRPGNEFGEFATYMMPSAADFSTTTDVLISVVRDERQTLDLYFEKQAVFGRPDYPKICLLASTVSPGFLTKIAPLFPADVVFFEIPMSGAPIAAEQERLTFMVGADEKTAEPVIPLLQAMGRDLHFMGGLGRGMTCKVLNNFVAASSVVAVRQVLDQATKLGHDPGQLLDVMKSSSGGTWFGNNFANIVWAREQYDLANTMGILQKDVNALLQTLQENQTDSQVMAYMKTIRDQLSKLPPSPES